MVANEEGASTRLAQSVTAYFAARSVTRVTITVTGRFAERDAPLPTTACECAFSDRLRGLHTGQLGLCWKICHQDHRLGLQVGILHCTDIMTEHNLTTKGSYTNLLPPCATVSGQAKT